MFETLGVGLVRLYRPGMSVLLGVSAHAVRARLLSVFLATVSVVVLTQYLAENAAASTGACASALSNYFRGYLRVPGSVQPTGSSANVIVRTSDQCDNANPASYRFSTAWTMIAGGSGGYAQTGFMRYAGARTKNFAEYNPGGSGSTFTRVFGNANLVSGDLYHYWQLYSTNCPPLEAGGPNRSCIVLKVNDATLSYTNFNPYSAWSTPFSNQYFGETTYQESTIPGTSAVPTDFNNAQWLTPLGWQDLNCQDLSRGQSHIASNQVVVSPDGTNCKHFRIWSTP